MTSRIDDETVLDSLNPLAHELRQLVGLAVPSILTGFGWMAMGFVDTVMVGRLGAEGLAATATANSLYFTIFVGYLGLIDAITPLISQALGRGDRRRAGTLLWQGVALGLVCGPPLALLFANLGGVLAHLGQAPEVVEGATAYLGARALGVIPHALFAPHRAFLNGLGRTSRVLRIVLAANLVNLVANQVLIFGVGSFEGLGVAGAGYATALSVTALCLGGAFEVHRGGYAEFGVEPTGPDRRLLAEVVRLGWPMSAQFTLEVSVFSVIALLVGWMGAEVLSAHHVALSLASFAFTIAGGCGTATTVRIGEAYGRGDGEAVAAIGRLGLGVSSVAMGLLGTAFLVAPEALAGVYTAEPGVITRVVGLLGVGAVFVLVDGVQAVAAAALRATSDSRTPFVVHMIGYWVFGLPVGYVLAFPLGYGLVGFWVGLTVALGVIAALLTGLFFRRATRAFA